MSITTWSLRALLVLALVAAYDPDHAARVAGHAWDQFLIAASTLHVG